MIITTFKSTLFLAQCGVLKKKKRFIYIYGKKRNLHIPKIIEHSWNCNIFWWSKNSILQTFTRVEGGQNSVASLPESTKINCYWLVFLNRFVTSSFKRSHPAADSRELYASVCWHALWRNSFPFPTGFCTCPHCQNYILVSWSGTTVFQWTRSAVDQKSTGIVHGKKTDCRSMAGLNCS